MGNLCDCFNSTKDSSPTPKTPLLGGGSQTSNTMPDVVFSTPAGQSARVHHLQPKEDFLTSLELLSLIELRRVTTVPSLDKSFQDHAKLYNDLYSSFLDLRRCLHDFKLQFELDTGGIPIIKDCLVLLRKRCGDATLQGSRTRNCIKIAYDARAVSRMCQGPAEDVIETLEMYNKANTNIKSVLEKAPQVKISINLILGDEQKLKREVTKADPDGRYGPEPLRIASANFSKLHKLPTYIDTIQKYTDRTFKEIMNGSKVLFDDES